MNITALQGNKWPGECEPVLASQSQRVQILDGVFGTHWQYCTFPVQNDQVGYEVEVIRDE